MKSVNVQDAAHELIDLLLGGGYEDDELKEKNGEEVENNDEGEHRGKVNFTFKHNKRYTM